MRLGIGEVEVAWRNVAAGTVGGRCVAFAGGAEARSVGVGGHSGEAACVAVGRRCMASTVAHRPGWWRQAWTASSVPRSSELLHQDHHQWPSDDGGATGARLDRLLRAATGARRPVSYLRALP